MSKGVVGSMDTLGYITEPTVKIDRALAYWFANRVDQCLIFRNVHSYQFVVASNQDSKGNEDKFLADIKQNLNEYLLQIFDSVSISAWAQRKEEGDRMFTLILSGVVAEDGKTYDLARSVIIEGGSYTLVNEGRILNG